jgi:hypothetical protein
MGADIPPPETATEPMEIARNAIRYVLQRIARDPDARYLFGACTETLRQLCMGYAALTPGCTVEEIERRTLARPQDSLGPSAWDRLDEMREEQGRLEERIGELGGYR